MRAYLKTTQHPFCIYLTADEAAAVVAELEAVPIQDDTLHLFKVRRLLGRVLDEAEEAKR
ncbi:hypothetical protein OG301_26680 [Streptomyces platensis]|uniref:hypothetical protein n=1 Tax=Streptomyces platensis TaxID=58346 RepID=UPI002ED0180E|nr:hypothetical protein OG301_26680 [Streptomyces platensis]